MKVDPRTPAIVGVGQVARSFAGDGEIYDAADSVSLMAQAVEVALADCWGRRLARKHRHCGGRRGDCGVTGIRPLWSQRSAASDPHGPCILLSAGRCRSICLPLSAIGFGPERSTLPLMTCGENNLSRRAQRKLGINIDRRPEPDIPESGPKPGPRTSALRWTWATPRPSSVAPRYPATATPSSTARCATEGARLSTSPEDRSASLWADYAAVAANNPHAADRSAMTAAQIRGPSSDNRFVSWPYTKAMCANNNVDHGGAIVVASTEAADRLASRAERRVYPQQCVLSSDTASLISRYEVATAPGLEAAGAALQTMIGDLDEVEHLDLYSCFPSMVALTTEVLQISADRALTVTGGWRSPAHRSTSRPVRV